MLPQTLNIKNPTVLFGYLRKHKYGGKDESEEKYNEKSGKLFK